MTTAPLCCCWYLCPAWAVWCFVGTSHGGSSTLLCCPSRAEQTGPAHSAAVSDTGTRASVVSGRHRWLQEWCCSLQLPSPSHLANRLKCGSQCQPCASGEVGTSSSPVAHGPARQVLSDTVTVFRLVESVTEGVSAVGGGKEERTNLVKTPWHYPDTFGASLTAKPFSQGCLLPLFRKQEHHELLTTSDVTSCHLCKVQCGDIASTVLSVGRRGITLSFPKLFRMVKWGVPYMREHWCTQQPLPSLDIG